LAGIGIVLLLSIVAGHWRNLMLVLINLPFAFVGGVFAVALTGGLLSLGSLVGFVTKFGITLRNSTLMMSHYEYLVTFQGRLWDGETAADGAADRLVPILMTSLVTALGLLPLALGVGEPGREIEGPMAVVILGGLMTSMALNNGPERVVVADAGTTLCPFRERTCWWEASKRSLMAHGGAAETPPAGNSLIR
jgi:Cu/Ag efflux pump CusA